VNEINQEQNLVRKIYKDLILGFSIFYKKDKVFSFKHLSEPEICGANEVYLKAFNEARYQGLLDREEKVKILCDQGVWSKDKENEIKKITEEIDVLQNTLKKLIIKSQIERIRDQISNLEKNLNKISKEKEELLGLTAENYAYKKSNEFVIYLSLYDKEFKRMLFNSEEEFSELNEIDLIDYINSYREFIETFRINNLKKIAVSPFFMNSFFLCEDDPLIFFGKPLINLTQYQIELFSVARNYKYYLTKSGENPPNNVKNLDELVNWYENRQTINNLKEKNKDKLGQSYVGATKEELMAMTSDSKEEVVDLTKEAQKAGGDLSFEEILKIHGI
jgi:hypothetical protein